MLSQLFIIKHTCKIMEISKDKEYRVQIFKAPIQCICDMFVLLIVRFFFQILSNPLGVSSQYQSNYLDIAVFYVLFVNRETAMLSRQLYLYQASWLQGIVMGVDICISMCICICKTCICRAGVALMFMCGHLKIAAVAHRLMKYFYVYLYLQNLYLSRGCCSNVYVQPFENCSCGSQLADEVWEHS